MSITSRIADRFDRNIVNLTADIYANRHAVAVLGDRLPELTHRVPAYPRTVNHAYTSRDSFKAATFLFLARVQSHVDLAPDTPHVQAAALTPPAAIPLLPAPKIAGLLSERVPTSKPEITWLPVPAMQHQLPAPKIAELMTPPKVDIRQVFENLMPNEGGLFADIGKSLASFTHFDELVERHICRYPHKAAELWDTTMLIRPYGEMLDFSQTAQDSHAIELLDRIVYGGDLTEPTKVEMLVVLLRISKTTPMRHAPTLLAVELAKEVIGRDMQNVIDKIGIQEGHKDELKKVRTEMIDYMKKKLVRQKPDHQRWYDKVSLEIKQETMKGVKAPDHLMVPASWERDHVENQPEELEIFVTIEVEL